MDRFVNLASRATVAAMVLSRGKEVKIHFLDAGAPEPGWFFAGLVALTSRGFVSESMPDHTCAMAQGRALFELALEAQQTVH
jgi:hypothetical protein